LNPTKKKEGNTAKEHNEIIWLTHHRDLLHKAILKTRANGFPYGLGHFVNYSKMRDALAIQSASDITQEDVLDRKMGKKMRAKIYAAIGFSKTHGRVPSSRTILHKLEENDQCQAKPIYKILILICIQYPTDLTNNNILFKFYRKVLFLAEFQNS
jgi:hypothetical protein